MGKSNPSILAETLRDRVVGPITRFQEEGEPAAEYVAWLAPEGAATDDGRVMEPGSLTWREPPLPLMASDRTLPGHLNAVLVGNLVDLDRAERDGVTWVTARVRWDSTDEARRFRELVDCALDDGDECAQMRGVSVDLAIDDADIRTDEELDEVDDDWPEGVWLRVRAGVILGATLVPMPAFEEAHVEPVTAAAYPVAPPAAWFTHDGIDGPTPLTVRDGRVFGHAALADTCHTGLAGCTTMPPDADLGMFLTGHVVTAEGSEVAVGQITLAGGHPADFDERGRLRSIDAVQRAYADTRSAVADVTAGYDEWGLWVAGALRPDVTDEQVRVLRASPLSGHWRWRDGEDHLIALVAVNSQGFPVRRLAASAVVTDGLVQARHTVGPEPLAASAGDGEPGTPELAEAVWALVADLRQALTIVTTELTRFRAQGRVDAALDRIGG